MGIHQWWEPVVANIIKYGILQEYVQIQNMISYFLYYIILKVFSEGCTEVPMLIFSTRWQQWTISTFKRVMDSRSVATTCRAMKTTGFRQFLGNMYRSHVSDKHNCIGTQNGKASTQDCRYEKHRNTFTTSYTHSAGIQQLWGSTRLLEMAASLSNKQINTKYRMKDSHHTCLDGFVDVSSYLVNLVCRRVIMFV